jgi:hypothetical protein
MPSTHDWAFEKAIFLWVIALQTDDHLDASRMITGGILFSAGAFVAPLFWRARAGLAGSEGPGGWSA